MDKWNLSANDAEYFVSSRTVTTDMYNLKDNSIDILYKNGEIKSISDASDLLNIQLLSKKAEKYYFSYLNI